MFLVDLQSISNSEFPDDWVLNLILSVLKLIIDPATKEQFKKDWYRLAEDHQDEPGAKELLESCLYYYCQNTRENLAEGRAEGEARGKAQIAVNLLSEGLDISFITKVTGLSAKELEDLSAQNL